jgi:hypothetical protein
MKASNWIILGIATITGIWFITKNASTSGTKYKVGNTLVWKPVEGYNFNLLIKAVEDFNNVMSYKFHDKDSPDANTYWYVAVAEVDASDEYIKA